MLVRDDVPGRGLPVVVSDDVALIKADIGRPDTVEEEATKAPVQPQPDT